MIEVKFQQKMYMNVQVYSVTWGKKDKYLDAVKSSRLEVFCKKAVLKILQNLQENTCVGFSFLIKLQA